MNLPPTPLIWLDAAILLALVGALCVGQVRNPLRAYRWGLICTWVTLACTVLACAGYYLCSANGMPLGFSLHGQLLGKQLLNIDELNAPLLPVVGLLHFLTALATGRTKMRRFSIRWSLASEAICLATFSCLEPWGVIGLLAAGAVPPFVELCNRGKPTRVYVVHMALFVALLILGWSFVEPQASHQLQSAWAAVPLLLAVLIRCGSIPAHCWITDWFEHASFGNGLLFVTPLVGVYAAVRLVLPIAPAWVLQGIGLVSLATAVYAAAMAVIQSEARRFFAYLFLSHASLVLVGLELHTDICLTGALALWISVALSLTGFGLTLRALEARFGRMSLAKYHGLYEHSPALAVCFLLTGLASVGFPGTLGFVAVELLVDGAVEASPYLGVILVAAAALNGIAIVRAYFRLFTGATHISTVSLAIGSRERIAVLTLAALILGGGMVPQPGLATRYGAALMLLREREQKAAPRNLPVAIVPSKLETSHRNRFHE